MPLESVESGATFFFAAMLAGEPPNTTKTVCGATAIIASPRLISSAWASSPEPMVLPATIAAPAKVEPLGIASFPSADTSVAPLPAVALAGQSAMTRASEPATRTCMRRRCGRIIAPTCAARTSPFAFAPWCSSAWERHALPALLDLGPRVRPRFSKSWLAMFRT